MFQRQHKFMLIFPALVLFLFAGGIIYGLAMPVNSGAGEAVVITVKPGMSSQAIGELLYERGLIKNIILFRIMAKAGGLDSSLQAGEYSFSPAMGVGEIIARLARGETAYIQFTIPEGYTIDQIAALLESKNLVSAAQFKAYLAGYAPYDYIAPKAGVKYAAEGFLFPDTYRVAAGISETQLAKMMVRQFDENFTPQMRQQAAAKGLTVREAVILASLVEKEAKADSERAVVASVFINRLKAQMPLQSCATIQYILGNPKAELTVADTKRPSPYNTYQNMGLPPGPIASPGLAAIQAVLNPAATDYLYFVAKKNGEHIFSRSYDEHLAAIAGAGQ